MVERLIDYLVGAQNPDGGWGPGPGSPSHTEATSLAVLALGVEEAPGPMGAVEGGLAWLRVRQRPDGAWPRSDEVPEPSWMTSLATIALGRRGEDRERVGAAVEWLVRSKGRQGSLWTRLAALLMGVESEREMDENLPGWPWTPETFGWIEPTAYALLALKLTRPDHASSDTERRVREGELMILDRMCPGGGWNYGNPRVLGEDLPPYPDTTALALLALQGSPLDGPVRESIETLGSISRQVDSGLSLALASVCLGLYGREHTDLLRRLEEGWEATGFRGEVRPTALAILAMDDRVDSLRVRSDG